MVACPAEVFKNALKLDAADRTALALEFLDSLDELSKDELSKEEVERPWAGEAQSSRDKFRAGRDHAVRVEEVANTAERLFR